MMRNVILHVILYSGAWFLTLLDDGHPLLKVMHDQLFGSSVIDF